MKLTSKEWMDKLRGLRYKVNIIDADGWRINFHYAFYKQKISYEDFLNRLSLSTIDCDKKIFDLKF